MREYHGYTMYIPQVNKERVYMFEYEFRLFTGELLSVIRMPREMSELDLADCLLELSQEHQAPVIWSLS